MPWKECSVMEERLRFVARLLDGEAMTRGVPGVRHLAQDRLQDLRPLQGARAGGADRSLAAAGALRQPAAATRSSSLIVDLKRDKPHWGARKIRELLVRKLAGDVRVPAKSTIHAVLDRHGLVKRMGRRRNRATGTPLSAGAASQRSVVRRLQGRVQARQRPLLLSADRHRPCLALSAAVRGLESTREDPAFTAFERLFRERGLPNAIRSDNGVPFASPNGLYNLSKLSVWWLRLGIAIERIKPGHPQQNGRHERMHLTLKKEATRPPGMNSLQQQARFDAFLASSTPNGRTRRSP